MTERKNASLTIEAQLEIAAQWLEEAAAATRDGELKSHLKRVAKDCLRALGVEVDE